MKRRKGEIEVAAELLRSASAGSFRKVQGDAVRGPAPLIGQCVALVRRQLSNRRGGKRCEAAGLLPRSEVLEVSHDANGSEWWERECITLLPA